MQRIGARNRRVFARGFGGGLSLLFFLLITAALADTAPQNVSPAEQELFVATNQARAEQGLPPFIWDVTLAYAARVHAEVMIQNPQLSHQYPGEAALPLRAAQAGASFQSIAENIAMGPNADAIQKEWMKSLPHRTNILDPNMNAIGFAVIEKSGYLYAVADFAKIVPDLTRDAVEKKVSQLLQARGIQPSDQTQDARQTCEMPGGVAGGSRPGFIMRWQSADLSKLPDVLVEHLNGGRFHSAAVGACAMANPGQGFTSYRVAVLLY